MNKVLKQMSLQAGGSHYPEINPQMQEAFARQIVETCAQLADRESSGPFETYGELIRDYFGMTDANK